MHNSRSFFRLHDAVLTIQKSAGIFHDYTRGVEIRFQKDPGTVREQWRMNSPRIIPK